MSAFEALDPWIRRAVRPRLDPDYRAAIVEASIRDRHAGAGR